MTKKLACAVLFSGTATTARALLAYAARLDSHYDIKLLLTNNPTALGIGLAADFSTELLILPDRVKGKRIRRGEWDVMLQDRLSSYSIGIVVLAGFMRILGANLVANWRGRMINIHPSLLPKYKGLDTHARVLAAKESEHGFSIHLVTPDLDAGPLLAQGRVAVEPTDTTASLQEKIQQQERYYYPKIIELIATKRLQLGDERPQLDREPLPLSGIELCDMDLS